MLDRDQECALAGAAGGEHEVTGPDLTGGARRYPREDRHHEDGDGDDRREAAGADEGAEHHRREDRGHGEDHVVDAHAEGLDEAVAGSGQHAERGAGGTAERNGECCRRQRVPSADHEHRGDVAAELVCPEEAEA